MDAYMRSSFSDKPVQFHENRFVTSSVQYSADLISQLALNLNLGMIATKFLEFYN